jgi:hypothetical protein
MNALLLLAVTIGITILTELTLWTLFMKGVTPVHFTKPFAPGFLHVSKPLRMLLLTGLHFVFIVAWLAIAYLTLW